MNVKSKWISFAMAASLFCALIPSASALEPDKQLNVETGTINLLEDSYTVVRSVLREVSFYGEEIPSAGFDYSETVFESTYSGELELLETQLIQQGRPGEPSVYLFKYQGIVYKNK